MAILRVQVLKDSWFRVALEGERAEDWSRTRLYGHLVTAGYSPEDALSLIMQAELAKQLEISIPPKRAD